MLNSPQDLFTASYSPAPGPIPAWQTGQPYGMGFGMQYYPNAMVSYAPRWSSGISSVLPLVKHTDTNERIMGFCYSLC